MLGLVRAAHVAVLVSGRWYGWSKTLYEFDVRAINAVFPRLEIDGYTGEEDLFAREGKADVVDAFEVFEDLEKELVGECEDRRRSLDDGRRLLPQLYHQRIELVGLSE